MARSNGGKGGKPVPLPILGGSDDDALPGSAAQDLILGRGGSDTLTGLGGNDVLDGGEGNDVLTGGTGRDTFVFAAGHDVVTDFDPLNRGSERIDVADPALVAIAADAKGYVMLIDGATSATLVLEGVMLADFTTNQIHHWIV